MSEQPSEQAIRSEQRRRAHIRRGEWMQLVIAAVAAGRVGEVARTEADRHLAEADKRFEPTKKLAPITPPIDEGIAEEKQRPTGEWIAVRFSVDEIERVERAAKLAGMSPSGWLQGAVLAELRRRDA